VNHDDRAAATFGAHIAQNPYPGRGLVIGRCESGDFLILYWIMGRSDNSRNRRFIVDGTTLRTEPIDLSKVEDPSLIIYEAMLELPDIQLVSNGDQTRTLCDVLADGGSFDGALQTREREPDAPNYTPRISGMLDFRNTRPEISLSILKASPFDPEQTDRFTFRPAMPATGCGVGLTTYQGDGNPLPSYAGDPLVLPLHGTPAAIVDRYFDALDEGNRIAVAAKHISETGACLDLVVRNRRA